MTPSEGTRPRLQKAPDADVHPSMPQDEEPESNLRRPGVSTGDSVGMPDKNKPVTLEVQIPKSLRKSVRAEAKRRGITVDDLVAEVLRDRRQQ